MCDFPLSQVVYLLIPTSNHNVEDVTEDSDKLYIFWFLHQTTTIGTELNVLTALYIFWFLHQTTTAWWWHSFTLKLYIFWFLHQTTTQLIVNYLTLSCISFDSYIKPQPRNIQWHDRSVVYLLIPTSNHNLPLSSIFCMMLYIFWFLHQTTTIGTEPN